MSSLSRLRFDAQILKENFLFTEKILYSGIILLFPLQRISEVDFSKNERKNEWKSTFMCSCCKKRHERGAVFDLDSRFNISWLRAF